MTDEQEQTTRLWGGRFSEGPSPEMVALSLSVHFDWRLAPYDLQGSRAHARVLARAGLLTDDELTAMIDALEGWTFDSVKGELTIRPEDHALLQPMFQVELVDQDGEWVPELVDTADAEAVAPPVAGE